MSGNDDDDDNLDNGALPGWLPANGWAESRRIACGMVDWKAPPWGEYRRRWVGRTWPRLKNVDRALEG
jgi:hypothetical protein